jgi:serine/threonine protein kinase
MFSESYHASLPWCAPEQLLGNPCTPATDIFAMGVIMWELCTQTQATTRRNYRAVEYPQEAPEIVAHLIRRCMVFEPANRPCASEVHDIIMASNNAGAGML